MKRASSELFWIIVGKTETLYLVLLLFLVACASPSRPQGGPKDMTPPKVLSTTPYNYNTRFDADEIVIAFDEYVTIESPLSEVIISPPINGTPEYKIKKKSVVIKLRDSAMLEPNTTYTLFFGKAIKDINEGNVLKNFKYVFSTGENLDSLSIHGTVVNAFDNKAPEEGVAQLYKNNNDTIPFDSLPFLTPPYYIAQVKNGRFSINNVKKDNYKLIVLADENNNFIYNYPTEAIAFKSETVTPEYESLGKSVPDSINPFSYGGVPVFFSLVNPSLIKVDGFGVLTWYTIPGWYNQLKNPLHDDHNHEEIESDDVNYDKEQNPHDTHQTNELLMFVATDSSFKYVDYSIIDTTKVSLYFSKLYYQDSLGLSFIDTLKRPIEYITQYSVTNDTVTLWMLERPSDSLVLQLSYGDRVIDTLNIVFEREKKRERRRRKKAEEEEEEVWIPLSASFKKSDDFFHYPSLNFTVPIATISFDSVILIEDVDTMKVAVAFGDELKFKLPIVYDYKLGSSYTIIVADSMFWDLFGSTNAELKTSFVTKRKDQYSTLEIEIEAMPYSGDYIIQLLLKGGDTPVKSQIIQQSETVVFEYLNPGKYDLKVVYDLNRNGKWDSGDYMKNSQPESTNFFSKQVELLSNWLVKEKWVIILPPTIR